MTLVTVLISRTDIEPNDIWVEFILIDFIVDSKKFLNDLIYSDELKFYSKILTNPAFEIKLNSNSISN